MQLYFYISVAGGSLPELKSKEHCTSEHRSKTVTTAPPRPEVEYMKIIKKLRSQTESQIQKLITVTVKLVCKVHAKVDVPHATAAL